MRVERVQHTPDCTGSSALPCHRSIDPGVRRIGTAQEWSGIDKFQIKSAFKAIPVSASSYQIRTGSLPMVQAQRCAGTRGYGE